MPLARDALILNIAFTFRDAPSTSIVRYFKVTLIHKYHKFGVRGICFQLLNRRQKARNAGRNLVTARRVPPSGCYQSGKGKTEFRFSREKSSFIRNFHA